MHVYVHVRVCSCVYECVFVRVHVQMCECVCVCVRVHMYISCENNGPSPDTTQESKQLSPLLLYSIQLRVPVTLLSMCVCVNSVQSCDTHMAPTRDPSDNHVQSRLQSDHAPLLCIGLDTRVLGMRMTWQSGSHTRC